MSTVLPDTNTAKHIFSTFVRADVTEVTRLTTGNQNFVYAVRTQQEEFVLRLTTQIHREKFLAALYWQELLLPLGIPLVPFIAHDLQGEHSAFPALLMRRAPGADLGLAYPSLSTADKASLASRMADIHRRLRSLPEWQGYGYLTCLTATPKFQSWSEFLLHDLDIAQAHIAQSNIFPDSYYNELLTLAKTLVPILSKVRPQLFMPDTTVKNVLVANGNISGIVDVDEMCAGDPLFVLSLTYAGSEVDGHDTLYAEHWASTLRLSTEEQIKLNYYRLLHIFWFMGEHKLRTANDQKMVFDEDLLTRMFITRYSQLQKMI